MVCKNIKEFEQRWEDISKKIEKSSLTRKQAGGIVKNFFEEIKIFSVNNHLYGKKEEPFDFFFAITEISTSLYVSLQIAISNYEEKHGITLFAKIFGNREFKIDINAIKNEINNKFV
ncbi:hypothetical protein J4429_00340 [Candidatus Pacearchaeota archaeon]|nr:hypothetical protein [Candidatus Pacearchaeota archaeon]